jgi:uncharacterized YigZ family protein
MITSFHTVNGSSTGEYREKGSKFIALAFPVSSEDEAKMRLTEVKKKYFDARHHCFAYVLGADKARFRVYDDGEPNHSAGDPIMGQIRSRNLTNVLVVVVRYFGGTKLGVGGLATAYKTAADEALKNITIVEQQIAVPVFFEFAYETTPVIMRLVKDFGLTIRTQAFENSCRMEAEVLLSLKEPLKEKVDLLNATGTPFKLRIKDAQRFD